MLGLWAWNTDTKKEATRVVQEPASAQNKVDGAAGKP